MWSSCSNWAVSVRELIKKLTLLIADVTLSIAQITIYNRRKFSSWTQTGHAGITNIQCASLNYIMTIGRIFNVINWQSSIATSTIYNTIIHTHSATPSIPMSMPVLQRININYNWPTWNPTRALTLPINRRSITTYISELHCIPLQYSHRLILLLF